MKGKRDREGVLHLFAVIRDGGKWRAIVGGVVAGDADDRVPCQCAR